MLTFDLRERFLQALSRAGLATVSCIRHQTTILMTAIRLYIGGLPGDITSKQLAGRFASFGSISAVELVPSKHSPIDGCRGFAYVDFSPKDDQALHRCLSLYNGCKWLGGVLRVEKAKPHFLHRLQTEWEAKLESQDESQDAACIQESSVQEDPVRIPTPASGFVKRKLMVVKPGPVKHIFAPYKGQRLSTLSWDPPPTPPGVRKRKAAEMAAAAFVKQPLVQQQPIMQQHEESCVLPGPPVRSNATEQAARQQQQQEADEQEQDQQAEASASSSDEGVVDFMSDDDDHDEDQSVGSQAMGLGQSNTLSRFDDSEEEELQNLDAPQQQADAVVTVRTTAGSAAPDLSRFDDSDDENPQLHGPSMQAAAVTAAVTPTAATADTDEDNEQLELRQSLAGDPQKQQKHASARHQQPAATLAAAAGDLSRFDDSNIEELEGDPGLIKQPIILTDRTNTPTAVSQEDPGASPAFVAASQPALLTASSSASQEASSVSSLENGLSDDAQACDGSDQQRPSGDLALSRDFQTQRQHPSEHKKALILDEPQHISEADAQSDLDVDAHSDSDSQMEPESGSEAEIGQSLTGSSDASGAGSHEEDQLLSEVPDLPPDEHTSMQFDDTQMESPAAQQLTAQPATKDVETASDASGLTEDSMQADAAQPSSVDATKEGSDEKDDALGVTPAGTSGAAVQEAPSNDSPPYPDIMTLQAGAAFWSQHQVMSDRAWQAQRQALHADYKAKHRAAAKHNHKGRKSCLT